MRVVVQLPQSTKCVFMLGELHEAETLAERLCVFPKLAGFPQDFNLHNRSSWSVRGASRNQCVGRSPQCIGRYLLDVGALIHSPLHYLIKGSHQALGNMIHAFYGGGCSGLMDAPRASSAASTWPHPWTAAGSVRTSEQETQRSLGCAVSSSSLQRRASAAVDLEQTCPPTLPCPPLRCPL